MAKLLQANVHHVKNRLIGHTQQARSWANSPSRCPNPICADVMEEHCKHLDSVVSMLEKLERTCIYNHHEDQNA